MDTISDMLTRIRNAYAARHATVEMPYSNMKWELARMLSRLGFVGEVDRVGKKEKRLIQIACKYANHQPPVRLLRRVSKPGLRVYVKKEKVFPKATERVRILSTPKGLMTDREAKKAGLGGEIICEVI
ncbi:MAG: 30S ribosomal protein S8 [Parcubacteria group bacterium]|nr:30S ribosomal protein S8 [Parcubacteria group bacterium]